MVPIGWTVNLISLLWVWLIFIGCSFALQDRNHVTFDVFYNAVPLRWRRIFAVITVSLLMSVFAYALGPTFDAIFGSRLMELKKNPDDYFANLWRKDRYQMAVCAVCFIHGYNNLAIGHAALSII